MDDDEEEKLRNAGGPFDGCGGNTVGLGCFIVIAVIITILLVIQALIHIPCHFPGITNGK